MSDARIRYGHVEGPGKGREYPIAADQYIARRGGKFVYLSGGNVTLCGSSNDPFGWVESSKDDSGKNAWKSESGDDVFVITGLEDVFEMPVDESGASLAASQIGLVFKFTQTGATYALVQKAVVDNSTSTKGVKVVDVDTDQKIVQVKMHPEYTQV